jgi:hypothetical protein
MIGAPRKSLIFLVPEERLELSRGYPHRILSPARLPFHHSGTRDIINNEATIGIQEERCIHRINRSGSEWMKIGLSGCELQNLPQR